VDVSGAAIMLLLRLPSEILRRLLNFLLVRELCTAGCTCRALAQISDDLARELCGDVRGLWSQGKSWRVQLAGRRYRTGQRVLHQYGSAGTRRGRGQIVKSPAAVAAVSDRVVAVADAGSCRVELLELESGSVVHSVPVDGVPTGVCMIPHNLLSWAAGHAPRDVLAVVVQGEHESGEALPGVSDARHRIELSPLPPLLNAVPPQPPLAGDDVEWKTTWSVAGLSYPNGAALVESSSSEPVHYLSCANWHGDATKPHARSRPRP
jgi:hypothetical protein